MKKILIIFIILLTISGCNINIKTTSTKEEKKDIKEEKNQIDKQKEKINEEISKITYVDLNNMPIGIYNDNNTNDTLTIQTEYSTKFQRGTDIGIFQILSSTENTIKLDKKYGQYFYDLWITNDPNHNIKQGFSIQYEVEGTLIDQIILKSEDTKVGSGIYLETYLYDDYANRNSSFYSHVEEDLEDTFYTAIKLTPGIEYEKITSDITLTAFTYDSEDDIKDNKYIGNSKYTIIVKNI